MNSWIGEFVVSFFDATNRLFDTFYLLGGVCNLFGLPSSTNGKSHETPSDKDSLLGGFTEYGRGSKTEFSTASIY